MNIKQQNGENSKSYVWSDDYNDEVDICGRDDEKNNKKEEKLKTSRYACSEKESFTTDEERDEANSQGMVKYDQESSNDSRIDTEKNDSEKKKTKKDENNCKEKGKLMGGSEYANAVLMDEFSGRMEIDAPVINGHRVCNDNYDDNN